MLSQRNRERQGYSRYETANARDHLAAESKRGRATADKRYLEWLIEQKQVRLQHISENQQDLRSGEQTSQFFKQYECLAICLIVFE